MTTTDVVLVPSAVTEPGVALTMEVVLLAGPEKKVTVWVSTMVPMVAVMVLVSALVDVNVAANVPFDAVLPAFDESVLFAPLTDNVTDWP